MNSYAELRASILAEHEMVAFVKDEELMDMNARLEEYLISRKITPEIFKSLQGQVALRIKQLARRASCRKLAEICYAPDSDMYGIQMVGRDLKRWAAIQLNELFLDSGLIKITDPDQSTYQDYWHEY